MNPSTIVIRPPRPDELQAVRQLRFEVLDQDKGLPLKVASQSDENPDSIHMAAFIGSKVISTVRLDVTSPGNYLVRRMATAKPYRRQGIGSRVLAAAEALAKHRGGSRIELHARQAACSFYIRAGYADQGGRPMYHGDTNIEMAKSII